MREVMQAYASPDHWIGSSGRVASTERLMPYNRFVSWDSRIVREA
jgi:hypothetical protein